MQKHVTLLGVLYIVYHAVGVMFALLIGGLTSSIGILTRDPQAMSILALFGSVLSTLLLALSAPGIVAGVGLLKMWPWSRYLVLILGFFNLIHFPLGTVLGGYTFWVLMQDETIELFEQADGSGSG